MKTYRFHGYSDDTFGEYGITNFDKDNCNSGKPITFQMMDENTNQSIYVTGHYGRYGNDTWGIEVTPANEYNKPNWTMRILFENYTAVLEVDVPDDAEILIRYIKR